MQLVPHFHFPSITFPRTFHFIYLIMRRSDLDLILAKATSSDDAALAEKFVWELANLFSSSPSTSQAFALSFTRRFGRTKSWRVAVKCLHLLHRLLRTLPSDHPFHSDLLRSHANAIISLNPCHFRCTSDEFTIFVRSYAYFLDEALFCLQDTIVYSPPPPETFAKKVEEVDQAVELVSQLQGMLDRAMECRPLGTAHRSSIVRSAMKHIICDSFMWYAALRPRLVVVLDNLLQMPHRVCVAGLGIYKKAAEQAGRLEECYDWCKRMSLCGLYEYPLVEKIPQIQVRAIESFVENMWQLTESSSSSSPVTFSSSSSTLMESESSSSKSVETVKIAAINVEWEMLEEEEKPLLQFGQESPSWEDLLEASVDCSWTWAPQTFDEPRASSQSNDDNGLGKHEGSLRENNPFLDHVSNSVTTL
ncbi:putative clathrin assembly protein At2g25430 [Phoenix dactylifera]|uniref:Clathrin assembly protein At2g25430 n=1 Tax=Phoenix dactylifera TaxID=42345 RepID=A0A8B9AAC9_PHODC|nr:putative clathrin assembly protein At2g25430 [Phoenix dactylifera]